MWHLPLCVGELPILSTQQVTACTPNTLHCGGSGGCMGSIAQLAFSYIQLFGHVTEDEWPCVFRQKIFYRRENICVQIHGG